jgi:tetratricopeptide (TPR) repeat protein
MKKPVLILILHAVMVFGLAAHLQPRLAPAAGINSSQNVFQILLGEGRRMFANHFAVKADVYMHSGLYPSIFDQAEAMEEYAKEEGKGHGEGEAEDHREGEEHGPHEAGFLGQPRDWLEALGRHFMITEHTHLHGGQEREILPWLMISAELDPQRIETYTVAAYWLADRLKRPQEAESFLRQGLHANPKSYEILFALGKIYFQHFHRPDQARNIWKLALRRWDEVEAKKEKPDNVAKEDILLNLAQLEKAQNNYPEAIAWLRQAKSYSPEPDDLDARIRELQTATRPARTNIMPPH